MNLIEVSSVWSKKTTICKVIFLLRCPEHCFNPLLIPCWSTSHAHWIYYPPMGTWDPQLAIISPIGDIVCKISSVLQCNARIHPRAVPYCRLWGRGVEKAETSCSRAGLETFPRGTGTGPWGHRHHWPHREAIISKYWSGCQPSTRK